MTTTKQTDIPLIIDRFNLDSKLTDRYRSFDFCYNYFLKTNNNSLIGQMEQSCLTLGFYLASWGMLRASSFLFQKSVKHLQSTIEYIASLDKKYWKIDIDTYTDENTDVLIEIYQKIKEVLVKEGARDLTLVTKVQLGVFGFVPAYDNNFCKTFGTIFNGKNQIRKCGFTSFNKNSLLCIKNFYDDNRITIDLLSNELFTLDFATGKKTGINYTKAKIIDMYGFTKAL